MDSERITVKKFREYLSLVPDDVEVWVGIGQFQSPMVEMLKDVKDNKIIIVNQTYMDDCIELEK